MPKIAAMALIGLLLFLLPAGKAHASVTESLAINVDFPSEILV